MRLLLLQRKRILCDSPPAHTVHRRCSRLLHMLLLRYRRLWRTLALLAQLSPMKRQISVIVKPTLFCGMQCKHCYHSAEERGSEYRLSFSLLERLFSLVSAEYESAWFIWHGGEPLTVGLPFFKKAVALQEQYFGEASHRVGNTVQTNGLLLDRKFEEFCRKKRINIGISCEGPLEDVLREDSEKVNRSVDRLIAKGHKFSVGCTICRETQSDQKRLYRYFRDKGINISFSPVIPAGGAADDKTLVPDADAYIRSSIEAYDEWLTDADSKVPLIPHYLYVLSALGEQVPSDCAHSSCLTKWICMYPNGDLYPCAKGCPKEFRLCNISEIENISDAFTTDGFRHILEGTIERREKCKDCNLFPYCNGGCSIDAFYEKGIGEKDGDSCRIFREVFTHVKTSIDDIMKTKPDLSAYNGFVRDAVLGRLVNPDIINNLK